MPLHYFFMQKIIVSAIKREQIFLYMLIYSIFENQPNEICSHLSERRHSNKGKGKQKRKSEDKERRRREKTMAVLLAFIIAVKNPASNTQCQTISILRSVQRSVQPPKWSPTVKWSPNRPFPFDHWIISLTFPLPF